LNRNAAKAFDWSKRDLWLYFGLGKNCESRYLLGLPFHPGIIAGEPKQIHETRIHADGHYVFLDEAGYCELKPEMLARVDGIDYRLMRKSVDYLKEVSFDHWNTLDLTYSRIAGESVDIIAGRLGLEERSTVYYRLHRAIYIISRYLHRHLDKIVKSDS